MTFAEITEAGKPVVRGIWFRHASGIGPSPGFRRRVRSQLLIVFSRAEILMVAKLENVSDTAYGKMI